MSLSYAKIKIRIAIGYLKVAGAQRAGEFKDDQITNFKIKYYQFEIISPY